MLRRFVLYPLIVTLMLALAAAPALARCTGDNLLAQLDPAESAWLDAAVAAQPWASGNLWQAERGAARIVLIGTYHLADPRHDALMAQIAPLLQDARALLVEAGPAEEQALRQEIAANPALLFLPEGPGLIQQMPPAEWAGIAQAARDRNLPAMIAARMRPWYLATLLAIPPCEAGDGAGTARGGLDHRLIALARTRAIAVSALEPHDTVFRVFEKLPQDQQLAMLRSAVLMEDQVADYAVTTSDAFFAGESRRAWEHLRLRTGALPGYTPARTDAEFALMERVLMSERNAAWIPVIEAAAQSGGGPVVVAFGALHLAGEAGVLSLLAQRGWQITALAAPPPDRPAPDQAPSDASMSRTSGMTRVP